MPDVARIQVTVNRPVYRVDSSDIQLNLYDTRGAMDKNNPIVTGATPRPGMMRVQIPSQITVQGNSLVSFQSVGGTLDFLAF